MPPPPPIDNPLATSPRTGGGEVGKRRYGGGYVTRICGFPLSGGADEPKFGEIGGRGAVGSVGVGDFWRL